MGGINRENERTRSGCHFFFTTISCYSIMTHTKAFSHCIQQQQYQCDSINTITRGEQSSRPRWINIDKGLRGVWKPTLVCIWSYDQHLTLAAYTHDKLLKMKVSLWQKLSKKKEDEGTGETACSKQQMDRQKREMWPVLPMQVRQKLCLCTCCPTTHWSGLISNNRGIISCRGIRPESDMI